MKRIEKDQQKEFERYTKRALKKLTDKKKILDIKLNDSLINKPYKETYFKLIKQRRNENHKVLEICSGEGECSEPILENFKNIVFTDISGASLEVMKIKFKDYLTSSIRFIKCNMESLPFEKDEFDIIFCAGGLSYGNNFQVLNEIYRVLKNKGVFIVIDSLNENPIYKINRYLHFIKGNRTKSTLKRMPNFRLLKKYKYKFGSTLIIFSGALIWILHPLSKFIGYSNSRKISDLFDNLLPNWMSFKFVMVAKKVK